MTTDGMKSKKSRRKKARSSKSLSLSNEFILQQIVYLLEKADLTIKEDMELAQRYAKQAKKLQMRRRLKLPKEWNNRFCKHCKLFLKPGVNSQVRLSSENRTITTRCNHCNKHTRFPYYSKKVKK